MPKSRIRFSKLEALGNDFMLVDARNQNFEPSAGQVRSLADRRLGIGFDQLLILASPSPGTDCLCAVRIFNSDGSPAEQCGNGMRAIALWLHRAGELSSSARLDTAGGAIGVHLETSDRITATLGVPDFTPSAWGCSAGRREWTEIQDHQTIALHGVSMGNPHLVIPWHARPDPQTLEKLAARFGAHPDLADGANISLAQPVDRRHVELAVFERGAGPTPACGSAACASAAVLISNDLVDSPVTIRQPGGELVIHWPGGDQPVEMTGPARLVFDGAMEFESEN